MTVEEAYKTLKDSKMSKLECNFKVKKEKGRSKPPIWFSNFVNNDFKAILNRLDNIESRLDNLENLVVTQFKKHGWVK